MDSNNFQNNNFDINCNHSDYAQMKLSEEENIKLAKTINQYQINEQLLIRNKLQRQKSKSLFDLSLNQPNKLNFINYNLTVICCHNLIKTLGMVNRPLDKPVWFNLIKIIQFWPKLSAQIAEKLALENCRLLGKLCDQSFSGLSLIFCSNASDYCSDLLLR